MIVVHLFRLLLWVAWGVMIIRGIFKEMKEKKANFEFIIFYLFAFMAMTSSRVTMCWVMTSRMPANNWQNFLFHHVIWSFTGNKWPIAFNFLCTSLLSVALCRIHNTTDKICQEYIYIPHIKVKSITATIVYWAGTLGNGILNKLWLCTLV